MRRTDSDVKSNQSTNQMQIQIQIQIVYCSQLIQVSYYAYKT